MIAGDIYISLTVNTDTYALVGVSAVLSKDDAQTDLTFHWKEHIVNVILKQTESVEATSTPPLRATRHNAATPIETKPAITQHAHIHALSLFISLTNAQ